MNRMFLRIRKVIAIVLSGIIALQVEAQNTFDATSFTPPSPTAYELGKYGQIPVGMFTGTPNVSVPLYEYKTANLSVPISLSYNSNGIRVDEISSNVGHGFSLNAGGVISRVVRDLPDERDGSADYPEKEIKEKGFNSPIPAQYVKNLAENSSLDSEADQFSYNFNGYSGRFTFDNNHKIVDFPKSDLKIEPYSDSNKKGFSITTPDGIIYLFTSTESTRNRSIGGGHDSNPFYITSWYLSYIIHPKGDIINFVYEYASYSYIASQSQTVTYTPYQPTCPGSPAFGPSVNTGLLIDHELSVSGVRLKEINSNIPGTGKIIISNNIAHPALSTYKLIDNISVFDKNNGLIEKFNFSYLTPVENKRAFLKEITYLDNNKKYQFQYITPELLPERLSYSQDHWGYYNGKNNNTIIPAPSLLEGSPMPPTLTEGANKNPDPAFAQMGLLKKISYPTKGYTELNYEANTYYGTREILPPLETLGLDVLTENTMQDSKTALISGIAFDQSAKVHIGVSFNDIPSCSAHQDDIIHQNITYYIKDLTTGTYPDIVQSGTFGSTILGNPGSIRADMDLSNTYQCRLVKL